MAYSRKIPRFNRRGRLVLTQAREVMLRDDKPSWAPWFYYRVDFRKFKRKMGL